MGNAELADKWMETVAPRFKEYEEVMRRQCQKDKVDFDYDVYADTFVKCYESIRKNGGKMKTEKDFIDYFFKAAKMNFKRERLYCRNRLKGELPAKTEEEEDDLHSTVKRQVYNDFRLTYIMELCERNFDSVTFYCFRIKWLMPKMTYAKLVETTGIADAKKRCKEVMDWIRANISESDIRKCFDSQFSDFL